MYQEKPRVVSKFISSLDELFLSRQDYGILAIKNLKDSNVNLCVWVCSVIVLVAQRS